MISVFSLGGFSVSMSVDDKDYKEKLIAAVKKEVKQVMEESVTRKFVHEESGSVTSLCGAVENCLSQGLRRRALGLFKTSSTTALLHKVAKHCPEADRISKKVQELENMDPNRRSSSSSDSVTKPTLKKNLSFPTSPLPRYLWIRLALFDKQLVKIIDYLVSNASKYYDKDALVADPDYGTILSSLLVGPCALDYSRTKSIEQFWTDPPADELVQRHRISSGHSTPPSVRRPILNFRRSLNTSSDDTLASRSTTQHIAKDYVESLHQNSRDALLYGKNNVLVMPVKSDVTEPMPGYLSLHQTPSGLTIKWTPNQLMNGFTEDSQDKSIYWDYALQVRLDEIVYVHCHQDSEAGGTIILVGQDGVQRPPFHLPKGGHMLDFLCCLENGLLPRGRLDPPLWSQRSGANSTKKRRRPLPALSETEETTKDYVFRIIDNSDHKEIIKRKDLMDTKASLPTKVRVQLCSTSTSSESSSKSFSIDQQSAPDSPPSTCIQAVCDSMKKQIISRAFYGWLAYCRHLSTVRTHLSGLVNNKIISGENASEGITIEKWAELCVDGIVEDYAEVYRLTYYGGIANELRTEIWPYLLGHYKFGSTPEQRKELDEETKQAYENTMSAWLAVEAIVKQRDKEDQAHAIAKLSSESMSGEQVPNEMHRDLSNEVFEDVITDDEESFSDDEKLESRKTMKTKQNTLIYESCDNEDDAYVKEETKVNGMEEPEPGDRFEENEPNSEENVVQNIDLEALSRCRISSVDNEESIIGDISDRNSDNEVQANRQELRDFIQNVIVTNASVDIINLESETSSRNYLDAVTEENNSALDTCIETHGLASPARSACVSPASSIGGVYSQELLKTFGLNLHRIEKDVQRCDRNYWYFANKNLEKLRNVMCTYVWEHIDIGYMQGMCDLVAPLLVTFDDEALTYACFCHLMERMIENFPNGNTMDCHFANMRSLIQVLDAEMYEQMHAHGDYTHFYFCYRWFLLDFKRELRGRDARGNGYRSSSGVFSQSGLHITIFILSLISSSMASWFIYNILDMYNFHCILYAKVIFEDTYEQRMRQMNRTHGVGSNVSATAGLNCTLTPDDPKCQKARQIDLPRNISEGKEWGSHLHFYDNRTDIQKRGDNEGFINLRKTAFATIYMCDLMFFAPLASLIMSIFLVSLTAVGGKGGAGNPGDLFPNPWICIYPFLGICGFMTVFSIISQRLFYHGLNIFCGKYFEYTQEKWCTEKMNKYNVQFSRNGQGPPKDFYSNYFYGDIVLRFTCAMWVIQALMYIFRILCLADFTTYLTRVKLKDDQKSVPETKMANIVMKLVDTSKVKNI